MCVTYINANNQTFHKQVSFVPRLLKLINSNGGVCGNRSHLLLKKASAPYLTMSRNFICNQGQILHFPGMS
jgi:hypothetical protein